MRQEIRRPGRVFFSFFAEDSDQIKIEIYVFGRSPRVISNRGGGGQKWKTQISGGQEVEKAPFPALPFHYPAGGDGREPHCKHQGRKSPDHLDLYVSRVCR